MSKKFLKVVAALIEKDNKILFAQRFEDDAYGSLWEFPGGTVEDAETDEQALRREIKEELGVEAEISEKIAAYSDESDILKIDVTLYKCNVLEGNPAAIDCNEICWTNANAAEELDLAPADRKAMVFVKKYLDNKKLTQKVNSDNI